MPLFTKCFKPASNFLMMVSFGIIFFRFRNRRNITIIFLILLLSSLLMIRSGSNKQKGGILSFWRTGQEFRPLDHPIVVCLTLILPVISHQTFLSSFLEKLIEAIKNDIQVAKDELDKTEFSSFFTDKFFTTDDKTSPHNLSNGNWMKLLYTRPPEMASQPSSVGVVGHFWGEGVWWIHPYPIQPTLGLVGYLWHHIQNIKWLMCHYFLLRTNTRSPPDLYF